MKQIIAARQYAPRQRYGQPSVLVSKEQCKRAPEVPWELPMLKSVYLLEKLNNLRDSLSIVRKCMRRCPTYLLLFALSSMSMNKCSGYLLCQTLEVLNSLLNAIISLFKVL